MGASAPAPDPEPLPVGKTAGADDGAPLDSAVGVLVVTSVGGVGVWHSFQPCLASKWSDTQVTAAPLETA